MNSNKSIMNYLVRKSLFSYKKTSERAFSFQPYLKLRNFRRNSTTKIYTFLKWINLLDLAQRCYFKSSRV